MTTQVSLPLWLLLFLCLLSFWTIGHKVLLPILRKSLRKREKRAVTQINKRLNLQLPPFKLTKRLVIIDRLLHDEKLRKDVKDYCTEIGQEEEDVLDKVRDYAKEIVPSFNAYLYFKFGSFLSKLIVRLLYRIRVGFSDEKNLAKIDSHSSIVFIMNHRSNMDYVLLGYFSFQRVALSFAVGEWARIWPLKQLISAMGAFFVRRGSKNPLYRIVLARYIQLATKGGVVQAVYPEGELSRDGNLAEPKLGILDYMLREFNPETDRDIVFIPVGVNYDRVLEDRTLLQESDPNAKQKSRMQIISTAFQYITHSFGLRIRGQWHRFGYAIVNFGSPISMKEFSKQHQINFNCLNKDKRIETVKNLAHDLMTGVGRVIPVTPVSLISNVFVENPEKYFSDFEIAARVQELLLMLERNKAQIYIPRKDWSYAVQVGLRMLILRRIIAIEDNLYRAVPEETKILRFYANSIHNLL
ncbi:MAG: 1-acyl-sn-glycerol-3-phosphate acyltransferase [Candidatus Aminicenantes bacterium]|nr:1-acyl-sn-glycerol-3-phosphate acyltransferase [Candidatus Aminicenantes bacterium]